MKARQMRKDTVNAVEISFNNYLNQRGFTGGLNIHKTDQELQLEASQLFIWSLPSAWQTSRESASSSALPLELGNKWAFKGEACYLSRIQFWTHTFQVEETMKYFTLL